MAKMASKAKSYLSCGNGVNLAQLRDFLRRELLEIVQAAGRGSKAMVIDPSLVLELGLVAEFSALKERGIDKISPITTAQFPPDYPTTVLYFTRPKPELMGHIVDHVMEDQKRREDRQYTVYFVPRKTIACEQALSSVHANLTLAEYALHFVPLDSDVLSMELPLCYRDCALAGDRTDLHHTASALMQLQAIFGIIPRVAGKGDHAKHVADMLVRMGRESALPMAAPEIQSLVLIDRAIDLVTPMCTQLTYEGFTDELLGISGSMVELPPSVAPPGPNGKPTKLELNSGDKLFAEIRDMHMAGVGPLLSARARSLRAEYDERKEAKTVTQIHSFTSKLKRMQDDQEALKRHTDLCTLFNGAAKGDAFATLLETEQNLMASADPDKPCEYVEDCIGRKEDVSKVLRLMCLHSVLCGGLKRSVLEGYRRDFVQTYGHEHLVTLDNLAKTSLLTLQETKGPFAVLRKPLRLVYDETPDNPTDIGYVHSGYAPISIRVAHLLAGEWRGHEEALRLLPGPTFDFNQALPQGLAPRSREGDSTRSAVTLVVFIGGCTYTEVSALRFLSRHTEDREYVVATTAFINGKSLLDSLTQKSL
eukprot:m.75588 g.75588  ORF g.75588 m.75588 type:complete len:592 (-) comp7825_c0_seq1:65-1840(-)